MRNLPSDGDDTLTYRVLYARLGTYALSAQHVPHSSECIDPTFPAIPQERLCRLLNRPVVIDDVI